MDWVEGDLSLDELLEEDFPPPEDGTISTLGAEEVLPLLLLPLPRLLPLSSYFLFLLLLDELFEDPELLPKLPDFRLSEESGLNSFKLLEVLDLWTSPE